MISVIQQFSVVLFLIKIHLNSPLPRSWAGGTGSKDDPFKNMRLKIMSQDLEGPFLQLF
jgi:hypothetical protein